MSENFEKIVLEKLNGMENRLIDKIESNQFMTNERLEKLENNQQITNQRLEKFENNQDDTKTQLNNLIFELKETQDVVKYNTSRIIELEHTFKDKIDALFDVHSVNDNKHKEFSKSIKHLQDETYNHDIRISILEDNLVNIKED